MRCNDPFLSYLKKFGYCVVRLPRADINPLQIYTKRGNTLERLGDLTTLFQMGDNISLPLMRKNILSADISGKRTGDLSIGLGLSLLESILGAMGGLTFDLHVKYQQATSLAFGFHDVLEDKIELAELDQYLTDADVNPFSRYVGDLLDADNVYVTTATIKSRQFTVEAKKSDSTTLDLSIPTIQEIVGGSVKVLGQTDMTSKLTYEGKVPLVFGFKAVQLFYDRGEYTTLEPVESGVSMRQGGKHGEASVTMLENEGPFLRFSGN